MLPFGVTIPATVPQRSQMPEGLMNHPVYKIVTKVKIVHGSELVTSAAVHGLEIIVHLYFR
jgi:hypothetical protein